MHVMRVSNLIHAFPTLPTWLIMLIYYTAAYAPIAGTRDAALVIMFIALSAWSIFNITEAALAGLVLLPLVYVYVNYPTVSTHPVLGMLHIALLAPGLATALYRVKVDWDSGVKSMSNALTVGGLYALMLNPALSLAYAAASPAVALGEAFSTPWLTPLPVLITMMLNYVTTGELTMGTAPVVLYTVNTESPVILHTPPVTLLAWLASPFIILITVALISQVNEWGMGRRVLYTALAGTLPTLPLGLLLWVPAGVMYIIHTFKRTDAYSELYSSIAHVPGEGELRRLYEENWGVLIGMEEAKAELIKASESFERSNVRPIHGVLLYGPAGTGKTALGLGYATWLGLYRGFTVIIVKVGELVANGPWYASWRLEKVFQLARFTQPSVIYFDEIERASPEH